MRYAFFFLICTSILLSACQAGAVPATGPISQEPAAALPASETPLPTPTRTQTPAPPTVTVTPSPTATASATPTPEPAGLIRVDTLEQEIYPFVQNGNCSLAEAISAANLLAPVDGCAAGVEDQTVIELMPGTYRLTRLDQTPQQVEWAVHTSGVGNALPAIARSLTLRGNGAVLSREDAGDEPFRILEVLYGTLNVQDLTLRGGDAGPEEWGGGMLVQFTSLTLDRVTFQNNKARFGGGLSFTNARLVIRDSQFLNNETTFRGGGLHIMDSKVEISNTRFIENVTDGLGAGLFADHIWMTITDSLFLRNYNHGFHGGGLSIREANATILRSQFYLNVSQRLGGGVSFRNYIYEEDIIDAETDPMIRLGQNDFFQQMETQTPGLRATLEAHPSGAFLPMELEIQIHDSCFKGNVTHFPEDPNWTSAISGVSSAENNYYGDPSGPGGMGPGQGDMVGKRIVFEPFLSEPPAYCDLSLAVEGQPR